MSSPVPDRTAYANAPLDLLQEIIRQAEDRLKQQAELARAADQRALALTNVYSALAAGAVTIAAGAWQQIDLRLLAVAAAATFIPFAAAMILAALAARPTRISVVGNDPSNWVDDIAAGRTLADALADTAAIYDAALRKNRVRMRGQAALLNAALTIMTLAPFAGVAGVAVVLMQR